MRINKIKEEKYITKPPSAPRAHDLTWHHVMPCNLHDHKIALLIKRFMNTYIHVVWYFRNEEKQEILWDYSMDLVKDFISDDLLEGLQKPESIENK